jgi:hypothetical protein
MIKTLRVVMIVWAVLAILMGAGFFFIPGQMADTLGMEKTSGSGLYNLAMLGITWIILSVFIIIAARDPLRNIMWVRIALVWAVFSFATDWYSWLRGYLDFSHASTGLIIDGLFTALLLIFYPWRVKEGSA